MEDKDITPEILINKLIKNTISDDNVWWGKKNFTDHIQYTYTYNLNDKITITFRIYHYKTHDFHTLNAVMQRGNYKYTSLLNVNSNRDRVLDLVKTIVNTKSYCDLDI